MIDKWSCLLFARWLVFIKCFTRVVDKRLAKLPLSIGERARRVRCKVQPHLGKRLAVWSPRLGAKYRTHDNACIRQLLESFCQTVLDPFRQTVEQAACAVGERVIAILL